MPPSSEQHKRTPQLQQGSQTSGWSPKALITGLVGIALGLIFYWNGYPLDVFWGGYTSTSGPWESRRQDVKEAFISSWDAYVKHAWGQFLLHPLQDVDPACSWVQNNTKV